VRATVYEGFARDGRAPTAEALGRRLGMGPAAVVASLHRLQENHHLALFPDRDEVWIANPFSAVPTDYPVRTERGTYWSNCAWDALGIPALLGIDGWTDTRCAQTGEPLAFGVQGGVRVGDGGFVHLSVPLGRAWDDIGFT